MKHSSRLYLAALSACLLLSACVIGPSEDDRTETDLAAAYRAVDEAIGEAPASARSLCRIVPLGAKPCGGPWFYRVYSSEQTDSSRLYQLAERYTELDRLRMTGRASDCMIEPPPTIVFEGGQCREPEAYRERLPFPSLAD